MPIGRAAWMHDAKWGLFLHVLAGPASSERGADLDPAAWDRRIAAIDVELLARQAAEAGAGWVALTLGQNSGHYCAPNPVYDALTGIRPSLCSRRDLMADLGAALAPRGIRLIAYLPSGAPEHHPAAVAALGWRKGGRCAAFQAHWEEVIRCWSDRWGRMVSGWWFDGCYWIEEMYRQPQAPNFTSFAAAARSGNPDAVLAWNPGVCHPPRSVCSEEDYTAGEVNEPDAFDPLGRMVGGAQFHLLSYLGQTWGQGPLRYDPGQAAALTRTFTDPGGAVTWDLPLLPGGKIADDTLAVLAAIGAAVGPTRDHPDRAPTPAPWPEISFPSEDLDRVRVRLDNRHGQRVAGRIRLGGRAVRVLGAAEIAYDLAPGAVSVTERAIAVIPSVERPALNLERLADGRRLSIGLPVRLRLALPRLPAPIAVDDVAAALAGVEPRIMTGADGRALAELRLARCAGDLVVHIRAFQADPVQTRHLWDGSCIELFAIGGGGSGRQLILAPAAGDLPARAVLVAPRSNADPDYQPAVGVRLADGRRAGAWDLQALIALAWWLDGAAPDGFRFDAIVGTDGRAALSGDLNAAHDSRSYALLV